MLGKNLKKIRESLDISQRELARRIGKTGQYISYLENSENSNPSLDVLNKIAEVLCIPLSKLTETSIEEKVNKILIDKNISIDELSTNLGNIIEILPTGEYKLMLHINPIGRLEKVSNALGVPFTTLIENTEFENYQLKPTYSLKDAVGDFNEYIKKQIQLRIKNKIPISAISRLLDVSENDIEKFEDEPSKYPEITDRYCLIINDILKVREMLFKTLLENIDIKQLFSISEKKQFLIGNALALYLNHQLEFEPKQKKLNIDKLIDRNNKLNKDK